MRTRAAALILTVAALAVPTAAAAVTGESAATATVADTLERRAEAVVSLLRRPADRRLPAALGALRRSLALAQEVSGDGDAAADLKRVRAGLRKARLARRAARNGKPRRARRRAAKARRRLSKPLDGLRAGAVPAAFPFPAATVDAPPPSDPPPAPAEEDREPPPLQLSGYAPVDLPPGKRPYETSTAVPLDTPNHPVDEDGVRQYERDGQKHPHPTLLEQYALFMLNGYRLHPDEPEYLRRARANADELIEHAVKPDGELWLSYTFDFNVFDNPDEHLAAPWHSGMAQGRALLLFHGLAEADPANAAEWTAAADAVFATTMRPRAPGRRWFSFTDDEGYLWFEEYPSDAVPPRVLNGHISATLGFWKRALATQDPEALRLFDAAATTARHYAAVLRRPGGYSAYSVRTPVQNERYHRLHIEQLRQLETVTGDPAFEQLAQEYEADYSG